jgi:hypothetical protein
MAAPAGTIGTHEMLIFPLKHFCIKYSCARTLQHDHLGVARFAFASLVYHNKMILEPKADFYCHKLHLLSDKIKLRFPDVISSP